MVQRFEGHNLEQALQSAAATLGVDRYRLKYRVLAEKRGFLGGVKRIVIEAEAGEEQQPAAAAPAPLPEMAPRDPHPAEFRRERSRGGGGDRGRGRGDSRSGGDRGRSRGRSDFAPRRESRKFIEAPEQTPRSPLAQKVADWFDELASLADFDVTIRTSERDEAIDVTLYGRDARLFVDRNGELLDALQTIANKSFRNEEKMIEIDALDFKKERAAELGEQAREIADAVRRDGREQTLPAMSPGERRIVHLALAEDADVTTESRGEGYFKKVTILPRRAAANVEP